MYQVNPTQLLEMIKAGHNPQQLIMSVLEGEMSQTPMGSNLLTLAKNKDGGIDMKEKEKDRLLPSLKRKQRSLD